MYSLCVVLGQREKRLRSGSQSKTFNLYAIHAVPSSSYIKYSAISHLVDVPVLGRTCSPPDVVGLTGYIPRKLAEAKTGPLQRNPDL